METKKPSRKSPDVSGSDETNRRRLVVIHENGKNLLRAYHIDGTRDEFELSLDQILLLAHSLTELVWQHYKLVPR